MKSVIVAVSVFALALPSLAMAYPHRHHAPFHHLRHGLLHPGRHYHHGRWPGHHHWPHHHNGGMHHGGMHHGGMHHGGGGHPHHGGQWH